jgi:hypothetical protein
MALLQKIKTISRRIVQLEGGTGNNQPARASDVNPIIQWVNNRSDVTTAANTATGNAVTLNAFSGTVISGTIATLTSLALNDVVVTNAYCTPSSTVLCVVTAVGTGAAVITKVVPAAGSFTVTLGNIGAITGTVTFKFIIL